MIKIAVVLLNYNSAGDCQKCVSYLNRQTGIESEIILVDNFSQPQDAILLKHIAEDQGAIFIASKENHGYNAGNNIGLRYAADKGYKYALIANPDMEFPQTDYLVKMVEKIKEDEDIVVCGSDIVSPEGIHQNPMKRDGDWKTSFGWLFAFIKRKPKDSYDFIDNYKESHYCSKVSGCCLLVRMDFIKDIDFFDESVFLYCEEAILSRLVETKQKKMYYTIEAQAVHRHVQSEKGNPTKHFKFWKASRIYFFNQYCTYPWYGKLLFLLSMRMYTALMLAYFKVKHVV